MVIRNVEERKLDEKNRVHLGQKNNSEVYLRVHKVGQEICLLVTKSTALEVIEWVCTVDKQGRIIIPKKAREIAGLNGNTVIIGELLDTNGEPSCLIISSDSFQRVLEWLLQQ